MRILKSGGALLILSFAMLAAPVGGGLIGVSEVQAQAISQVVVEGNQRVEAETVRSYVSLSPGQAYSPQLADESLKALFATGLFSDVRLEMRGSQLVVVVQENPIINVVSFEGNEKLSDSVLEAEVESAPRAVMTRARIQQDVMRILQMYRRSGRFGARVEPQIIDLPENRVNLVFEIDEGDKTSVARINFIGNQAFSDRALRDVVTTSEKNWLSWLKSTDIYDPERLQADEELLRQHYLNNGYADFRVISAVADFDRERNSFFITFTVDEGPLYHFGNVDVETYVRDVDPEALRALMRTRPGQVYSAEEVDKTLEDMTFYLANQGYAFAQVRPRGDRDFASQTISIAYVVEEGPRAYVERINIRGNTRTLDHVIRREFDFAEGDAYNAVLLDRARRRLEALRYFKSVNISREQGSAPDRVVLNVDVVEQPTGELSLGGGYSTRDGFLVDVSLTERNLLGRGQTMRIAGSLGEYRESIDVGFTEPYFLGRRLAFGIDGFYRNVDYEGSGESSYMSETIGGGVRLGFQLTDDLSMLTRYQLYRTEIAIEGRLVDGCPPTCVGDVAPPEASIALKQAIGDRLYSVAGYDLVYSTVNSYRRPTEGVYAKLSQDLAGLGGDVNFLRTEAEARYYHEVYQDIVGMLKIQGGHVAGWGGDDVLITDTFFKGSDLVRGFESGGFGPRDLTPGTRKDALGGKIYAGGTAELQFPFPFIPDEMGFSGALFADAGVLFDVGETGTLPECVSFSGNDGVAPGPDPDAGCYVDEAAIRASVGLSVIWDSPFGPLRGDLGYAVVKEDYDEEQVFRFGTAKQF